MKHVVLLVAILVFLQGAWTLPKHAAAQQPTPTAREAAEPLSTIITWLECEECTAGELQAVVKLGVAAVSTLARTLREGPPQARREQLHRHLISTYQELKKYETTHPDAKVPMSEEEYVRTYLENYVALYQLRAGIALGAIGGSDANRALEEALQAPLREDVKAVVEDSIKKLKTP